VHGCSSCLCRNCEFICSKSAPMNVCNYYYTGAYVCKSHILYFLSLELHLHVRGFYIGLALVCFYRMWGACLFFCKIYISGARGSRRIAHWSRIEDQGSRIKDQREHINSLNVDCVNGLISVFYLAMHVMNVLNVRMCMNINMHDNLKFWITC